VDLGRGDDVLKGFGSGMFNGGSGVDQLLFSDGVYQVVASGNGFSIGTVMEVSNFETIGSAALLGQTVALTRGVSGVLTITGTSATFL